MKELKTIKFDPASADTYEITDAAARGRLTTVENTVSGIPTTYATKTEIANKQDQLVSGSNIKTINNQSLLGSGNIDISGGGSYTLPIASSTTLGGIKVGSGLTINSNGVLSANGGGSSSMLVIEPTPVVYESLTWNQVLEKAFDVNSFYGLVFIGGTPSDLLIDSTSSFTLSNADISIMVSADTITVTVGTVSRNIYENGSWDSKSTRVIKDEGIDIGVRYMSRGPFGASLDFVYQGTGVATAVILDTTEASSIRNISSNVLFTKSAEGNAFALNNIISNTNIVCTDVIFDSTFENNLVNDTYVKIGAFPDSSLELQSDSGTCWVNCEYGGFYSSGWQPTSTDLGNGCSWDVSTYTLTFPASAPLKLRVESPLLSYVSNNITFKVKISGGEIIIPDASDYSNQLAEIKDTINNVDLIIYSTGSEWKFASDVLQLNRKQFDSIPTESNSLYGISVENKWCLNPNNGLPAKVLTDSSGWIINDYQEQFSNVNISSPAYIEVWPFMNVNCNVTSSNSALTFYVNPSTYLSTILINVSDTVPTITFTELGSTGAAFIFKQDGTTVSSLTFAQDTYYKLTLNGANFNNQHVIFVECQSFPKPVGE